MKLIIVSDIHGNYNAWRALPEDYDELWVLGDLVNYGPQPKEVVTEVMSKASLVVQGNHDYAVAYNDDSRWSSQWRAASEATRKYTSSVLNDEVKTYLRKLPLQMQVEREGLRFHLVHAKPSDPLYGTWPTKEDELAAELEALPADVVLIGHTHVPSLRRIGGKVLLNPGSIGQPRAGNPLASYAVWQDGSFELRSFRYPIEETARKLRALTLPRDVETELIGILETGSV